MFPTGWLLTSEFFHQLAVRQRRGLLPNHFGQSCY